MLTVVPPPTAPKGTVRYPDIVATDAIEVAHAALDGYLQGIKKPNKDLVALRDMLWSAMLHSGDPGGTAASKQNFYDHVAHIACHTEMEWHCTMTSELLNALQAKAENGVVMAKRLLEMCSEAKSRTPGLKVVD